MEKTGLIDSIALNINRRWRSHLLVNASKEMKEQNLVLSETLSLLKKVNAANNLHLALGVEEMMLRQELAAYANSPEQHNSVGMAINQLLEAKKSLAVVHDSKGYQTVAETYSPKRKEAGLPIDSFREFLKSHTARLSNQMKSRLSVSEKISCASGKKISA